MEYKDMTYAQWFNTHSQKHKSIVDTLIYKSKDEIIEYFEYENMAQNHNDFCLLYATNTKCHDVKNLNCYACGCPYFRFNDDGLGSTNGKVVYSKCIKGLGGVFDSDDSIHHDCSACEVPHKAKFISDNFDIDWRVLMGGVATELNS